ncbi:MAG: sigma-54 dependent transcriptional regulator [Gammaproteobacteria bacterium]|nr:sigma-54 dependent transcriptional regulator [Gammaproteobacteria bacterium]MBU1775125.1 sigma-54 dependent transcriptional regulator [Gammaproteobacteria bacterium]MBU1968492.1 sigma-54 dependent transcriptional regulator [Gammaproteobacteria bacterium]
MTLPALLIVDDDPLIRDSLLLVLGDDFDIHLAEDRPQAIRLLRDMDSPPQLALVDLGLPPTPHRPEEGFRLITELLAHSPNIKVVTLSGQNEESNARHARTLGAIEFVAKPCPPETLRKLLLDALRIQQSEQAGLADSQSQFGIVGNSPPIQAMRSQIELYAKTPYPVLIEGESGSGKELVAAALQRLSGTPDTAHVVLNCAAISPNLLESTLFGHAKGAFTGATSAQIGFFEKAENGTLFLDEIGEMPQELQAKLLRVLENGEYQRVGEAATRKSNARIIAATNRDLRQAARTGAFRTDLYHRLSIFTIQVPPLRTLAEDKLLLLEHFSRFYATQAQRPVFELDEAALQAWQGYPFPGNTRELRNIVIRLTTKYPGIKVNAKQLEAEFDPLPEGTGTSSGDAVADARLVLQQGNFDLDDLLMGYTARYIDAAMEMAHGNVSEAAKLLGIARTTLYSRMEAIQKHKAHKIQ